MPFSMSRVMAYFNSSNKSFIWLVQIKGMSGGNKCGNGCNFSDDAKAYGTWLIKPNHE